jgi:DNA uptake protein ComE-like DNA-binding protein
MFVNLQDLNTVTKEELIRIPGISEETADAILRYRTTRGGIHDLSDLENAEGVTRGHIDHLRPWVSVGSGDTDGSSQSRMR